MRLPFAALSLLLATLPSNAQWEIQTSHNTSDLRGIHSIGIGIAWASGTSGAILRSTDDGHSWHTCAIPPGAEHLDFRGVQALSAETALVMSSGTGDLSRLYETTDGCRTWKLLFANPDKEGFWDALLYEPALDEIVILGDPVQGRFAIFVCGLADQRCRKSSDSHPPQAIAGEAAFAASNSILIAGRGVGHFSFVTGGSRSEIVHELGSRAPLPFLAGESSGAFSIARNLQHIVVVGGDYQHPGKREATAAFSTDAGRNFLAAETPPGGYRSAVAYDARHDAWIAVGPNGTDLSIDAGRNWRPLRPAPGDAPGSDRDWNALSLPFAVGPHGRIGKLRVHVLDR